MNIQELLNYASEPEQKLILTPLLTEVGTLLLKLVYSMLDETDLDRAKVLVYNAGIEADWLNILAEGNPAHIDHVIEQAYHDVNNELSANLVCLEHDVLFGNVIDITIWPQLEDLDKEEIAYLADEFGVQFDNGVIEEDDVVTLIHKDLRNKGDLDEQLKEGFKAQRKLWNQKDIDSIADMFTEGDLE